MPTHISDSANSEAFVPLIVRLEMCKGELPVFVNVTVCGALLPDVMIPAKDKVVGARLAARVGATPVPESGTWRPVLEGGNEILRTAVRELAALGAKVTLIEQLAPEARLVTQSLA